MNEPLKGKIVDTKDYTWGSCIAPSDVFSAVEWLKDNLSHTPLTKEKDIYYWINKAFEDVTKTKSIKIKRHNDK